MKAVTLKEVAAHAGVSRATASLVIRETGRVSDATRARVYSAMDELGYVYNHSAASLRTQRSRTIGVVVTNMASPYWGELLHGLQAKLRTRDFLPLIAESGNDPSRQDEAIDELRRHRVAGIAVIPAAGTDGSLVRRLEDAHIPYVMMARYLRDVDATYVGPDDVAGGRSAAAHLIGHGCKRLAYVGGPTTAVSRWDRIEGMREAIRAASSHISLVDELGGSDGEAGLAAALWFQGFRDETPDGILCHNDSVAFGLYRGLRAAGLTRFPRVIGFDDIGAAALWEPPLTSVATGGAGLGELAAQVLLDRLEDSELANRQIFTEPRLVIRESCGRHSLP